MRQLQMGKLRSLLGVTRAHFGEVIHGYLAREYLPAPRRDDDLFLVEFPKSGITWLTFLVANANALLSGDSREATFFNINDFVPDVQVARHAGASTLLRVPGYRCFKSHSHFNRRYRKVFYLVRDPRHVMVSYFAFLNALGWWKGTLPQLIEHPQYGIGAWVTHVSGWLDRVDAATSFTLIRYEDLVSDTVGEMRRLYALLGFQLDDQTLKTVVDRSSIEHMRESEVMCYAAQPNRGGGEFVRRGQVGGPRLSLPDESRHRIEAKAAWVLKRLGYSV